MAPAPSTTTHPSPSTVPASDQSQHEAQHGDGSHSSQANEHTTTGEAQNHPKHQTDGGDQTADNAHKSPGSQNTIQESVHTLKVVSLSNGKPASKPLASINKYVHKITESGYIVKLTLAA